LPTQYYVGYDYETTPEFARAPLVRGKTYYWAIDEFDGSNIWPGRVWSFTVMPEKAWDPNPFDGREHVMADPDVTLTWKQGDVDEGGSVAYNVFYGTDKAAVAAATVPNIAATPSSSVLIAGLPPKTTYYWRVDTLVTNGPPPPFLTVTIPGDVWEFTTLAELVITDPNLMGWWKFDEVGSSTVLDWSGHGNHGTINGDLWYVAGQLESALEFDGSSTFVSTGKSAASLGIEGARPKTVTAWVYTRSFNNGGIFDVGTRTDGEEFCQ